MRAGLLGQKCKKCRGRGDGGRYVLPETPLGYPVWREVCRVIVDSEGRIIYLQPSSLTTLL